MSEEFYYAPRILRACFTIDVRCPADIFVESIPHARVQPLLAPEDTALAFKATQLLGADSVGASMIVRHDASGAATGNTCELWLLRVSGPTYVISARNGDVVDCLYNESAKGASALGLDHNLIVTPTTVSYMNELVRGGATYVFALDSGKRTWYIKHVDASWVENSETGVTVYKFALDYSATLPWLTLDIFKPKAIRDAVRSTVSRWWFSSNPFEISI